MAGGAADERQARVVPRLEHRSQEMASLPIPDELMAEIFLRLPTPADLARASATCVSFRRVTTDRPFLRRYRKLHAPPLLGILERHGVFHPATAPHTSASATRAVALAADFSFLPAADSEWVVQDIRDGRVLLYRSCRRGTNAFPMEFVACDPLHRRYLLLPRIADDIPVSSVCSADLFLVPPSPTGGDEAAEETSFRVVWMALCTTRELLVFVFSSNTGQWQAIPSQHLCAGLPPLGSTSIFYSRHQYVYGCFYSVIFCGQAFKVLVVNAETMELSVAEAPLEAKGSCDFAMGRQAWDVCDRR